MKDKIWCINCKHYDQYYNPETACLENMSKPTKNPIAPDYGIHGGDVFIHNKNNNCKDFEQKDVETNEQFEKRMEESREAIKKKYQPTIIDKIFKVIFFILGISGVLLLSVFIAI